MEPVALSKRARIAYKFTIDGTDTWIAGTVRRSTVRALWIDVSFDDGEQMQVLVQAAAEGTVWRHTTTPPPVPAVVVAVASVAVERPTAPPRRQRSNIRKRACAPAAAKQQSAARQQRGNKTLPTSKSLNAIGQPRFQHSKYMGVRWDGQHWRAEIFPYSAHRSRRDGDAGGSKPTLLGYFEEEEDAARVYDRAALNDQSARMRFEKSGMKRKLNFPHDQATTLALPPGSSTSLLRGVKWDGTSDRWVALIKRNASSAAEILPGRFCDEAAAGRAYDAAALVVHGLAAKLNFVESLQQPIGECPRDRVVRKQKTATTSRYRGVSWDKRRRYWIVQISKLDHNEVVRGIQDEEEAARKYDELAIRIHKHKAQLNFPQPELLATLELQARKEGNYDSCRGSSSAFRGVSLISTKKPSTKNKWAANIRVGGKQRFLGVFSDEVSAARAYDTAARLICGTGACLNFRTEELALEAERQMKRSAEKAKTQAPESRSVF
jgi:hypothetical protein